MMRTRFRIARNLVTLACLGTGLVVAVASGTSAQPFEPGSGVATPGSFHQWPIDSYPDTSNDSGFDLRPEDESGGIMPVRPVHDATPDVGISTATPSPVPVTLAH